MSVLPRRSRCSARRSGRCHGQSHGRPRARRARPAARGADARVRAAPAAQHGAGPVPRAQLRNALPDPSPARRERLRHGVRRQQRLRLGRRPDRLARRQPLGRSAGPSGLRAHVRRPPAVPDAGARRGAGQLGGRQFRRPAGLLLPHRRRGAAARARGPAQPAGGAPGARERLARAQPRARRPVHPRAAAARTGVSAAGGPVARRADLRGAVPARRRAVHRCPTHRTAVHRTAENHVKENRMGSVRVAIIGAGNCAASLVQGVHYYRDADPDVSVPGLMHVVFGDYHVRDVEFVAAFDVDAKKVGFDLSEAIVSSENNTIRICDVPPLGVPVQRGHTLDGLGKYYRETIEESDAEPVDVVRVLRETRADVLVSYLPVGSEQADKFYAQCAIDSKVAFVNALPVFIASDPEWAAKFEQAGVPIIGDDIKSQVGATITHRVMAKLFEDRGVVLDRTYQLNVGGNMDFKNMLERERLESKKISKTQAVTSNLEHELGARNVHIGPSDYVQWLDDRKWAYVRLEGRAFGDVPLNLEYKLEVWDSPNSAGVIIDALRAAKIAKDRGVGGPVVSASAYFMKSQPVQVADDIAKVNVEKFIAGELER